MDEAVKDIGTYITSEKTELAMKEINQNPTKYTRVFLGIYQRLCRHCKAKVHRKFLSKQNTDLNEYCDKCQEMARREWERWK